MFQSFLLAGVAAIVCSVAGAAPAEATVLDFDLAVSNGADSTWTLPSSPVPQYYFSDGTEIAVSLTGAYSSADLIEFRTSSNKGGLIVGNLGFGGAQIFGGTTDAPIFAPGIFDLTGTSRPSSNETAVLTITAVPEAATWAMMLVGLGLVGAVARRRQQVRIAYA